VTPSPIDPDLLAEPELIEYARVAADIVRRRANRTRTATMVNSFMGDDPSSLADCLSALAMLTAVGVAIAQSPRTPTSPASGTATPLMSGWASRPSGPRTRWT